MLKYCDNDVERLPKVKYFEILILSSEGITGEETGEIDISPLNYHHPSL